MDRHAFISFLQVYKLTPDQLEAYADLAEEFQAFVDGSGRHPDAGTAWDFSRLLIRQERNSRKNYIALIRYCRFIKNNAMFTAFMELVDGGEVAENLHRLVAEKFGTSLRDEVYAGTPVPPLGLPSPEKPATLQPVIARLADRVGQAACRDFLSASLRDLPDEDFAPEREKYLQAGSLDLYLHQRKDEFMATLEKCQRENRLFFVQEITDEVLDFVRCDSEMGGGICRGNVIYETKIPYMTKQYLQEGDPALKRYYACHCPWAREAIRDGSTELQPIFCHCSGGFHKKPLEAAFGQPLKVDVLETVLQGDMRCRFAIHLPEGFPVA